MATTIEQKVMQRVHFIHAVRPLVSNGALALVVFLVAMWGIGREVWVARVFQNMPSGDVNHLTTFWFAAFTHTRIVVQALALVSLASVIYLARETARFITGAFSLTYA
jgi:hypothetical protein